MIGGLGVNVASGSLRLTSKKQVLDMAWIHGCLLPSQGMNQASTLWQRARSVNMASCNSTRGELERNLDTYATQTSGYVANTCPERAKRRLWILERP